MFQKAYDNFYAKVKEANDWKVFMNHLNGANIVLTPWFLFKKKVN